MICFDCESERKVDLYAIDEVRIKVLCEDCWVIEYERGTYIDEEGTIILPQIENR